MAAKQGVLGGHLIFEFPVESKLVLWLSVGHFVPPEPVNGGLQIARFQALHITNVWRKSEMEKKKTRLNEATRQDWWGKAPDFPYC